MASATVVSVDFSDTEQVYVLDIKRTNGTLLTNVSMSFPASMDPIAVRAQIAAIWDSAERARPRAQRRMIPVGTVIDLG